MTSPTSHGEPGLKGKHVLITGAGGGIGQALIEAYNGLGAIVSGADQQRRLIESLPLSNRLVFDLNDKTAASKAIGDFIADRGVPDVLINNAGFTRGETLDQVDGDVWEQEIATNLNGVFHVTAPIVLT